MPRTLLALAVLSLGLASSASAQRVAARPAAAAATSGVPAFSGGVWDSWGSYWELRTWSQGWNQAGSIAPLPQLDPNAVRTAPKLSAAPAPAPAGSILSVVQPEAKPEAPALAALKSKVPNVDFRLRAVEPLQRPGVSPSKRLAVWMSGKEGGLAEASASAARPLGIKTLIGRLAVPSFLSGRKPLSDEDAKNEAGSDFEYRIEPAAPEPFGSAQGGTALAAAPTPEAPKHRYYPSFPKDETAPKAAPKNAALLLAAAPASLDRPMVDAPRDVQDPGAALAPLKLVRRDRNSPSLSQRALTGSAPLSRFYISLKAPAFEDPAAFLERSVDELNREAGFKMERALGYRPEAGGPVLIVLGELPPARLDGLRRVPQVAGLDPAPSLGVSDFHDAPNSTSANPYTTWLRGGIPALFSALLLAFPWIGMLLRRIWL